MKTHRDLPLRSRERERERDGVSLFVFSLQKASRSGEVLCLQHKSVLLSESLLRFAYIALSSFSFLPPPSLHHQMDSTLFLLYIYICYLNILPLLFYIMYLHDITSALFHPFSSFRRIHHL